MSQAHHDSYQNLPVTQFDSPDDARAKGKSAITLQIDVGVDIGEAPADDGELTPVDDYEGDDIWMSAEAPKESHEASDHHQRLLESSTDYVCLDTTHNPKTASEPEARLLSAAQRGDLLELHRCFRWCVSVDATCDQGATALHYASYMGHDQVVGALLDHRADAGVTMGGIVMLEGKQISNPTTLRLAAARGKTAVVRVLFGKSADVSPRGKRPVNNLGIAEPAATLPWALSFGHMEIALILMEHGASLLIAPCLGYTGPGNPESLLPVRSPNLAEELQVAAEHGLEFVNHLLSPLFEDVKADMTRNNGLCISVQGPEHPGIAFDQSPTSVEISYSNFLCCMDLDLINIISRLTAPFDRRRDVSGWTPLHHAAISENTRIMKAMLISGASPHILTPVGFTPLHLAVGPAASPTSQNDVISALLDHGADINAPDERGYTALHVASEYHRFQAVLQLLNFDTSQASITTQPANPNSAAPDSERNSSLSRTTPLDLALRNQSSSFETAEAVAEMLLLAGADVDHAGRHGLTALHHATKARNVSLVTLLLNFGADCRVRADGDNGSPGKTPLHCAVSEPLQRDNGNSALQLRTQVRIVDDLSTAEATILSALLDSLDDDERASVIHLHGGELLQLVVSRESVSSLEILLQNGAVTDGDGAINHSILKTAASQGSREMVKLILGKSFQGIGEDYGQFLRLFEVFLESSLGAAMVREECANLIREAGLEDRLFQAAKERGFVRLARFWEDQRGLWCCSPASIFGGYT